MRRRLGGSQHGLRLRFGDGRHDRRGRGDHRCRRGRRGGAVQAAAQLLEAVLQRIGLVP